MDGETQARLWKDPDARGSGGGTGAGEEHPAGELSIRSRVLTGVRWAVLAGAAVGAGVLGFDDGSITGHTTVSWLPG